MPLSKNLNTYADVRAILDQILPHGQGTYRLRTEGAARHWMMRAYQFRKLEQEAGRLRAGVKGYTPPTPYDMIRMRLSGASVVIEFAPEPEGEISLPGGRVVKPNLPEPGVAPPQPAAAKTVGAIPKDLSLLIESAEDLLKECGDED